MTFFKDLTPYSFKRSAIRTNSVNVGWLDIAHTYQVGSVPLEMIEALWRFCRAPVVRTRGFHVCNLCHASQPGPLRVTQGDETLKLSTAEIRVFGSNKIYAAPDLIYHYVTKHAYQPPDEFVVAVISGPSPGTEAYQELLEQLRLN
jgi:hypothetical protein